MRDFAKPQITLANVTCRDGVVRQRWELSLHAGADDLLYVLRAAHFAPADAVTFWSLDRASRNDLELVDQEEYVARRNDIADHDEDDLPLDQRSPVVAQLASGLRTRADALNRADALLADTTVVMSPFEAQVHAYLRRQWDAFTLLFNPAVTL